MLLFLGICYLDNVRGQILFISMDFSVLCALLQVLASDNLSYGYNAATGQYVDLMAAGIIDPTKVFASSSATPMLNH